MFPTSYWVTTNAKAQDEILPQAWFDVSQSVRPQVPLPLDTANHQFIHRNVDLVAKEYSMSTVGSSLSKD